MRQTGHRTPTTLRNYIREAEAFENDAAEGLL
jgi:hypothetical protein